MTVPSAVIVPPSCRELYSQTPALVPAILDALLHLTLSEDSLQEVHHTVLKTLHAAQPHHLPCVLRFLLHNTSSGVAYQVWSEARDDAPQCWKRL